MNNLYLIKSGDNGFVEETSAVISAEGGDISINGGLNVDSAGNIGIGTSDPTNKLDVVGSASISSDLTVDNITFSNVGGQSPAAANDIIKYDGNSWVVAAASTLPGGGGGAGNSDVPAGMINSLSQGKTIHPINFGFKEDGSRVVYDNVPKIAASLEIDGPGEIIPHTVSGVSQSGYFVVFSEELPTANYRMHTVFGGTDAFWETGVVNLEYSERNVEIDRSLYVGQRVGIGTTSPADELHINSTSSNVNLRLTRDTDTGGRISCSDGADTPAIIFETIDSGNLLEKMRIDSDGNVGIGTTSPDKKLEVVLEDDTAYGEGGTGRGIRVKNESTSASSYTSLELIAGLAGSSSIARIHAIQDNITNASTSLAFTLRTSSNNTKERMRIDSAGNVGIGTTNPNAKLVIQEDSVVNTLTEAVSFLGGNYTSASNAESFKFFHQTNTANTNRGVAFKSINGSLQIQTIVTSSNADAANNISLQPGGGNVGIGTTSPIYPLDVFGFGKSIAITSQHADGTRITHASLSNDSSGDGLIALNNDVGNSKVRILSNGKSYFNGGNVGIGTTTPDSKLHVSGDYIQVDNGYGLTTVGGLKYIADSDNNAPSSGALHSFFTDNGATTALTILKSGNVGIGTTNPGTHKLFVNGNGTVSNDLLIGQNYGNGYSEVTIRGDAGADSSLGSFTWQNYRSGNNYPMGKIDVHRSSGTDTSGAMLFSTGSGGSLAERLRITSAGNVGIGTTNPSAKLDIHTTGASAWGLKVRTDNGDADSIKLVGGAGDSDVKFVVKGTGNVGIGTTNPGSYKLYVNGNAFSSGTWGTSDDRVKHNEQPIVKALETISKITPKKYIKTVEMYEANHDFELDADGNPIDENGEPVEHRIEAGVIAQQVLTVDELAFAVSPEGVDEDGTVTSPHGLDYNSLFTYAIAAIQEQQTIIEDLKSRIENLEQ